MIDNVQQERQVMRNLTRCLRFTETLQSFLSSTLPFPFHTLPPPLLSSSSSSSFSSSSFSVRIFGGYDYQLVSQSVRQSVGQSFGRSVGRSVSQSVGSQLVSQSVSQSVSPSVRRSVGQAGWQAGRQSVSQLVSWCFKPSQPQRIISGLRETFKKRYLQLKGPTRQKKTQKNRVRKWRLW